MFEEEDPQEAEEGEEEAEEGEEEAEDGEGQEVKPRGERGPTFEATEKRSLSKTSDGSTPQIHIRSKGKHKQTNSRSSCYHQTC